MQQYSQKLELKSTLFHQNTVYEFIHSWEDAKISVWLRWEAAIYCLTLQHHIHHFVYTRYMYLKVGVASGYTHLITFGDYSIDFVMVMNSPIK